MMQEDSQNSGGLSALSILARRHDVNNLWFNNKIVTLDGYTFNNCRFDSCRLNISSTNFEINRCHIDERTVINYSGEIVKVLRLFTCRYEWFYENSPYFTPDRHEDGTFSIVYK